MKKDKEAVFGYFFTILLICICIAILMGVSIKTYSNIENRVNSNNNTRAINSYLTLSIRNFDSYGGVEIRDDGQMLVLKEPTSDGIYEIRIFVHDGKLVEQYAFSDDPIDTDEVTYVADTSKISFSFVNDDLIKISSDEGEIFVSLHSGGNK